MCEILRDYPYDENTKNKIIREFFKRDQLESKSIVYHVFSFIVFCMIEIEFLKVL